MNPKRRAIPALIAATILALPSNITQAANRKGAKRQGGSNSHGKGSKYVGGKKK